MNFTQRIQEERELISKEIEQLQRENDADFKKLEEFKAEYLYSSDVNEIDIMNAQIRDLTEKMALRRQKIDFLQNDNPALENIYTTQIKSWINEKQDLEAESEELFKKLSVHRQELLNGMNQLAANSYRIGLLKGYIKSNKDKIKDVEFRKMAFVEGDKNNNTARILNSLFIERNEVNWKK